MVSIVIVSHSAKLAEGIKELAEQMMQTPVAIAIAGGIDDPENPIGTDAMKVYNAIEAVYSEDGVIVLMDMGSALLSADMALELLAEEKRKHVHLSAAPVVEGAIAATVQASTGSKLAQILQEAMQSLEAKKQQIDPGRSRLPAVETETPPADRNWQSMELVIPNRLGLHARPAARFVGLINAYESEVEIIKDGHRANARSINQVATLGVRYADRITVQAAGPDVQQLFAAIRALAEDNFGDDETEAIEIEATAAESKKDFQGIGVSPGVAVAPIVYYRPQIPEIKSHKAEDVNEEWQRLQSAIAQAEEEIQTLLKKSVRRDGRSEGEIFEAHLLILRDPSLLESVRKRLFDNQLNAESVWSQVVDETAQTYKTMSDAYMQGRALDIYDVGQRVLRQLMDVELPPLDFESPVILVAMELTPSDTARLNAEKVLALCTEQGGANSHTAILARALGIPAVAGVGRSLKQLRDGQMLGLDGESGQLWPSPDKERVQELQSRRKAWLEKEREMKASAHQESITADGHRVHVEANIGGPADVSSALEYGAEGVGLFRTEFLFFDRENPPTEQEQLEAYQAVAKDMGDRPVIIRTLDVGGDKPLPYLDLGLEDNPFLGWRGIRYSLDNPELLRIQLRAILKAGHGANFRVMFPMVSTVEEVRQARKILDEVRAELQKAGRPIAENMPVGIMIEVPSAVVIADQLASEVDFFSIGTNDLIQYVMAADRGNASVASLADAFQPAVLRMIQQTVQAAHQANIKVSMCGEMAGNALAAPLLAGLGIDNLSMSARSIPAIKATIRSINLDKARQQVEKALQMTTAGEVLAFLRASSQ